ncbi:hypothetical protein TVAG_467830 [Trichomonas vaginalis G3]|uniref:Isochorismatase-like domain-containing protein n=1 Tax=Trichomonas vaginalis (strain ATCC PRA-98 / G3) TaxID=412133 RepID=A2E0M3_TRIV3|nr:hypothetical protein TVAGG3_0074050 [Trichomonas vaginalis G3]EAY13768.1 hypothetical protein TVAG_467830 [Trichomonas vaginalis G3]KAI5542716.1 hypothetical protein TVAGG3_0074050 [Trichomonas vaginalis G3]|eukprot:XP_001325991.1 hypothetical protein [Trichomonas vaginalis G3]
MKHLPKRPHVRPIVINKLRIMQIIVGIITVIITVSVFQLLPNVNSFPPTPRRPLFFNLPVHTSNDSTTLNIDFHKIIFVISLIPNESCIYTLDRFHFIVPFINRFLQYAHSFKFPIIQLTFNRIVREIDIQRIRAFKAVEGGKKVNSYHSQSNKKQRKSLIDSNIIGKCIYEDPININTKQLPDTNPDLIRHLRDIYLINKDEIANAVYGLGGKYVLIAGSNLESDIMKITQILSNNNLTPIVFSDLVDPNYNYNIQKHHYSNHSSYKQEKLKQLSDYGGYYISTTEFMNSIRKLHIKPSSIEYLLSNPPVRVFNFLI